MTKEKIIEECKQRLGFETDCEMYSLCQREKDFYNAIIKALEQQPSEDCVSRKAVLDTLMKCEKPCDDRQDFYLDSTTEFEEEIKALKPVTPTRKQGKWDKGYGFPDGAYWKCSCCNELIKVRYPMNYCPNCGAGMRGDSDDRN